MRTKLTNYLQIAVLITGVLYIFTGLFFYFSPLDVLKFFAENVSENWLDMVRDNELVGPLFKIARGLAALLFTAGFAMIMPLFDPLRYRGLIYYNGVVFPFFALFISALDWISAEKVPAAAAKNADVMTINIFFIIILSAVLLLNISGLLLTKKLAGRGIE
jgi:hypothetical protein